MASNKKKAILRIELWHGLLLAMLFGILVPAGMVDAGAFLVGGIFMALNFFLLGLGVSFLLAPLADAGRVKLGVGLLTLKILLLLALLTTLFFKLHLDGLSFAVGFSCLIPAILIESGRQVLGFASE
jgi:hypothetical protein